MVKKSSLLLAFSNEEWKLKSKVLLCVCGHSNIVQTIPCWADSEFLLKDYTFHPGNPLILKLLPREEPCSYWEEMFTYYLVFWGKLWPYMAGWKFQLWTVGCQQEFRWENSEMVVDNSGFSLSYIKGSDNVTAFVTFITSLSSWWVKLACFDLIALSSDHWYVVQIVLIFVLAVMIWITGCLFVLF